MSCFPTHERMFFLQIDETSGRPEGKKWPLLGGGARDLYRDDVKADMGPSSRVDI